MDEPGKLRVMIVENEYAMLEVLREYCSMQPDIVCAAAVSTGREALDRIYGLSVDVLLLDLVMPGPDGLAVLEQLQTNPPSPRPRVIVISSFGGDQVVLEALRLGADYYMVKPLILEDLMGKIRMLGRRNPVPAGINVPLRCRIDYLLQEAGSDRSNLGHTYLVDTLERMAEGGPTQYLNAIFRDVAEKWCTSESGVAEAVRRDMAKMYRAKTPFYQSLRLPDNNGKPPSIGKFLGAFAFYLQPLPEALLRERSM